MKKLPLVSCMMITSDRLEYVKISISCFQNQTYEPRELLIIDNGKSDDTKRYVDGLFEPTVRLIRVQDYGLTLGDLRNLGVGEANGELLCVWDDDDIYHPKRLEAQISKLLEKEVVANFLDEILFWWIAENKIIISGKRHWEGTMITFKSHMPTYPSLPRAEDTPVANYIVDNNDVSFLTNPLLYVYVKHGNNTTPNELFETNYSNASKRYEGSEFSKFYSSLSQELPVSEYKTSWACRELRTKGPEPLELDNKRSELEALTNKLMLFDDRGFGSWRY